MKSAVSIGKMRRVVNADIPVTCKRSSMESSFVLHGVATPDGVPAEGAASGTAANEGGLASPRSDSSSNVTGSFQFGCNGYCKEMCKKLFLNRIPKGKAVFIVFLINVLETCAFYSALKIINHTVFGMKNESDNLSVSLNFNIFMYTAGRVFYPLAGLVADVYIGRNRVIQIGMWLFWMGFAIILIVFAAELNQNVFDHWLKLLPILVAVLLISGSACIESTIIPFGMDQIEQGASSEELSSYFFWYYIGRQLGYILSILLSTVISYIYYIARNASREDEHNEENIVDQNIQSCVVCAVMLTLMTFSILLHFYANKWFFKARQRSNPLRIITSILFFAATVKRHAPRYRRSFRYGEGRLPRIELAKLEYDGKYSSEEVEDVKTFVRVLFIIFSLGFTFTSYAAVSEGHTASNVIKYNENSLVLLISQCGRTLQVSTKDIHIIFMSLSKFLKRITQMNLDMYILQQF